MNKKINDIMVLYCEKEMTDFKASSIYGKLNTLIKNFNLLIECEYGNEKTKKCGNIYMSITIFDEKNNMIEIYDEGFLTTSTILISRDKKDRYKFYSWKDDEFIDDINWIIEQIKKM